MPAQTQFQLAEPIIDGLRAQLAAQLPGQIAQINQRTSSDPQGNTYQIANPAQVLDHVPTLAKLSGGGFPAVCIEDMGSQIEDDLVSSVTGAHRLAVLGFVNDPDPEALAWGLRRYQQAIMLAIQQDRTLGGAAWTTTFARVNPGPALQQADPLKGTDYLSWFAVEILCRRAEV